jgi:predicted RNase H-like HicB family nuclease
MQSESEVALAEHTFTAVLHFEDPWWVATCPEVGTVSQGQSIEEAVANLKESTEVYLEEFPLKDTEHSAKTIHPLVTTFEAACA